MGRAPSRQHAAEESSGNPVRDRATVRRALAQARTAHEARLWSLEETAAFLGVPANTLYGWNSRGGGPRSFRVGKYRRYDPDDVRRWLEAHASGPSAGDAA